VDIGGALEVPPGRPGPPGRVPNGDGSGPGLRRASTAQSNAGGSVASSTSAPAPPARRSPRALPGRAAVGPSKRATRVHGTSRGGQVGVVAGPQLPHQDDDLAAKVIAGVGGSWWGARCRRRSKAINRRDAPAVR